MQSELWSLSVLVVGGFVATNLDNLIILVVLLGAAPVRRVPVLLGYLCAAIVVMVISSLGVIIGTALDPAVLGYLGLAPLLLGLYLLYQLCAGGKASDLPARDPRAGREVEGWLGSFLLLVSNSGDSVALFLPLLAESSREALLLIVTLFLLLTLVWCALCLVIAGEPRLARRIEKRAARWVPWIMMAIGLYVLLDTGTDTLV